MEAFVRKLQMQLQEDLNAIATETNPIEGYDKRIEIVEMAIRRMKEHLSNTSFPDKDSEIQYFKFWSLPFIKLYIYYIALYNLETTRITSDKEQFLQYLGYEKKRLMVFFSEHQDLYRYFKAGRSDEDERYFTVKMPSRTTDFLTADNAFCRASLDLGELLAYEDYKIILEDEIDRTKAGNLAGKKIEIKVPKSAVAEVIGPIFELQWIYIDDRPATLNELIRLVEKGLHIDLKDFSVIDNANRNRKKSTNPYLEQMIMASNGRRERLDP
jgi:hypothetical protein